MQLIIEMGKHEIAVFSLSVTRSFVFRARGEMILKLQNKKLAKEKPELRLITHASVLGIRQVQNIR